MCGWAKLLLSVDPTLETNIYKPHVTSQATLQDNPPLTLLFMLRQLTPLLKINQAIFKCLKRTPIFQITHTLPNIMLMLLDLCILLRVYQVLPYKLLNIKHLYTKSLGIVRRSYHIKFLHIKCLHIKSLLILFTMSKPLLKKHNRKNLFNVEKRPIKIYTPLTKPVDQFYEELRLGGYIAPISEIRMNTHARWIKPSKVCAYHSGMKENTIEDKIQQLIDTTIICLEDFAPTKFQQ
ncbi:hypothetical protein AABB24_030992 [Solanum stoloniferum]|uniref:Uncharacterized protein n=1 Tax=Solanum stoloniferum TaxID=62892 RepID=A0ABD2RRP8_9SOLN